VSVAHLEPPEQPKGCARANESQSSTVRILVGSEALEV
jgi:hypothetical protein